MMDYYNIKKKKVVASDRMQVFVADEEKYRWQRMRIKNAMVYTKDHKFEKADIQVEDEHIMKITPCESGMQEKAAGLSAADVHREDSPEIDAEGLYAIPGLVDIHLHGAVGYDFCTATVDELEKIAEYEAEHGILAICPATMSYSEEILGNIMDKARLYKQRHDAVNRVQSTAENISCADLVGIHMEGPFISRKKAGAQNPAYIQPADMGMFRRLQERSGGLIRLLDLAPETDGAMAFVEQCHREVKISLGHTCCTYETAKEAFGKGAAHLTHLYNAMPDIGHREPGPILAAVEAGAEAELITDGIHNHPAAVRLAFQLFGSERIVLISDSMEATGLPDGLYQLGGQSVTVKGKEAVLTDHPDTIAGSVTNLYECMVQCVKKMQIPLEDAVRAATENPARAIGIDDVYGKIAPGYRADIVLMDQSLEIQGIVCSGKVLKEYE